MFSRTTRSLTADNARGATGALLVIAVLLSVWVLWLSFARITLYEQSVHARLDSQSRLVATFPQAAFGRIQLEQAAHVRFDAFPSAQYGTLSAQVVHVAPQLTDEQFAVTLALQPDTPDTLSLQPGLSGTAEVALEQVSPATLLWRAAGF